MRDIASPVQRVGVRNETSIAMMVTLRPQPQILAFGTFELDTATGELRKGGRLIHLRHQSVRVIQLLLERAGTLVTRKEITSALWPDDLDVDVEQGLNHCMKEIRAALGDRPESPRFVQTLPRRGYRFLGEVRDLRALRDRDRATGTALGPNPGPTATPFGLPASATPDGVESRESEHTVAEAKGIAPGNPGMRVRVKVLVTRPGDDAVLWSETYDRRTGEVDRLERDLTSGIRSGMRVAAASTEGDAPADPDPDAPRRDQRFE